MGLFVLSPASTHLRISGPSRPPRLCNLQTKFFGPNTSSAHLLRNQSWLTSLLHGQKVKNLSEFGRSNSTSSIKVTTNQLGHLPEDKSLTSIKQMNMLDLAVRFIRPYIFFGTLISYMATTARTSLENPHLNPISLLNWSFPLRALLSLSVLLGVDAYIMIMNQISDVEIDRINKPYLPLASGEVSLRQTWTLVISCALHSIATATFLDCQALLPFVLLDLSFGTIYSVRPFYTKRSTFGAILTCAFMRGFAFSLMHCAAASAALGIPFRFSPAVVFLSVFSTLVGFSISIMKDLPDLEGDKKCNVRTLALVIGAEKASYIGFGFLFLAYAGAVAAAICLPGVFRWSVVVPAHLLLGCCIIFQAWKLVKKNYSKDASKSFFRFLWTLLDVENLIFPFI